MLLTREPFSPAPDSLSEEGKYENYSVVLEIDPQLRVLATLPDDLDLILNNHMVAHSVRNCSPREPGTDLPVGIKPIHTK